LLMKLISRIWEAVRSMKKVEFWASLRGFLFLAAIVIVIWIANFWAMPYLYPPTASGLSNAGTAGDMFGGITALFSGLAFAGLITTLFMQRRELELQRKELCQTREIFAVQRFENTFFGLINLLAEHVRSIEVELQNSTVQGNVIETYRGREAMRYYANDFLISKTRSDKMFNGNKDSKGAKELISEYGEYFLDEMEHNLGPYFRLIYNILRHIESLEFSDNTGINDKQKYVYSKILRSHLSSSEVKLLMFNCASVHGKGLKKWVEKHAMLKHIRRDDYKNYEVIVEEYDPNAFRFGERKKTDRVSL
jgi:putative phage abortive infection protein